MLILFNYLKLDNRILNNKVLKSIKFIDNNSGIYYIRKWLNSERSMECSKKDYYQCCLLLR